MELLESVYKTVEVSGTSIFLVLIMMPKRG